MAVKTILNLCGRLDFISLFLVYLQQETQRAQDFPSTSLFHFFFFNKMCLCTNQFFGDDDRCEQVISSLHTDSNTACLLFLM